jgi:hypothetical protein
MMMMRRILLFVFLHFPTMVEGSSSDWMDSSSMQELWDVWSTRIMITLVLIGIFEYLQSNQRRALAPPAPPPLQYGERQPNSRVVAASNRLLDSLQEQETTNKNDLSPETAEPSTGDDDDDDVLIATRDIDHVAEEIGLEEDEAPKEEEDKDNGADDSVEETPQMNDAAAEIGLLEEDEAPKEDKDDGADDEDDKEEKREEKKEEKASKKKMPRTSRVQNHRNPAPKPKSNNPPPKIKAINNLHPGMGAFSYWYEVETSLFRIYTLGRKDDVQVVPPYIPHSYRGNVGVFLHVTNHTNIPIKVFWVDYLGKHVFKGDLKPEHVWTQTTYIDHPWVFEDAETQTPLLYYIPYRVIPTLPDVPTVSDEDGTTGRHQFALVPPAPMSPHWVGIDDHVMPFPATTYFLNPLRGITWTLQQLSRMNTLDNNGSSMELDKLYKYLTNIVKSPEQVKFRQIRIRGPNFAPIWQSPMRGLLLAVGFVEEHAYAELGCHDLPLSRERIQDLALLTYLLTEWKLKQDYNSDSTHIANSSSEVEQPQGADGWGRAGFGRAGQMNNLPE